MTCPKLAIFIGACIVCFIPLFPSSQYLYATYNLPKDQSVTSDSKEIVKCVTNQIQTNYGLQSQVKGFFAEQNNIPEERFLSAGEKFTYKCCGKKKAIYKWGLYQYGSPHPYPLICRVNVEKNGSCSVMWATDFNTSYSGRISVEYDKSTSCVLWSIDSVTKTDEKAYVAFLRDNLELGHGFKSCIPVYLNISIVPSPSQPVTTKQPAASDEPTMNTKTQNPSQTTTQVYEHPSQTTTQVYEPTQTRDVKQLTKSQKASIIAAVIMILVLSIIIICICFRKSIKDIIVKARTRFQTKNDDGNVLESEHSITRDSK